MTKYAEKTTVPIDRSRAEIEKILSRYGTDAFIYGWDSKAEKPQAVIMFRMRNKQIKFTIPMPTIESKDVSYTPSGRKRTKDQIELVKTQISRQRWRALTLVIKAKLESVESGISVFEEEFLAHIILPNGQTIGEFIIPQMESIYEHGKMPKLLPGISSEIPEEG